MVDKNNKISFAVEDVRVIDERNDSQFAEVQIDVFASGVNRHEMIVSVDTLKRTAKTILMKPLVYVYDKIFDDLGSHSELEVPGGIVPSDSPIEYRELPDGRTMMTVFGRIWKRYSGDLISFFQRDHNVKPVSVEMEVYETKENPDGLVELLDFCYTAITILGSLVTPAIPGAQMSVIKFAKEYEEDYKKEFSSKYNELDLSIPETIKNNIEKALSLHKAKGKGANSVVLALAHHLQKNTHADPARIKNMAKMLNNYAKKDLSDENSNEYISYLALGGQEGHRWASELANAIEKIDSQNLSYFTEQVDNEKKEVNLSMEDEEKKDEVENKEEEKKEEEKQEEKKEEMAAENPEEEKKEEDKEEEKENYSLDAYLDVSAMLSMLEHETENYRQIVESEFARPDGEKNFAKAFGAVFAKMQKMCDEMKKMAADQDEMKKQHDEMKKKHDEMMAENESLKKFKSDVEQEKFNSQIMAVMAEVKENMPEKEFEALQEKSKEFSLDSIDGFKNLARAKAFEFSKGKKDKNGDDILRIGLNWNHQENKKTGSSWDRLGV